MNYRRWPVYMCVCMYRPGYHAQFLQSSFCRLSEILERPGVKVDTTCCACVVCSGSRFCRCLYLHHRHGDAFAAGRVCFITAGRSNVELLYYSYMYNYIKCKSPLIYRICLQEGLRRTVMEAMHSFVSVVKDTCSGDSGGGTRPHTNVSRLLSSFLQAHVLYWSSKVTCWSSYSCQRHRCKHLALSYL